MQSYVENLLLNITKKERDEEKEEMKDITPRIQEISSQILQLFSECVNDKLSSLKFIYPKKKNVSNNKDYIDLEYFTTFQEVHLRGDKTKYGLVVGGKGKQLQEFKNNYKIKDIQVPSKDDKTDSTIIIKGKECMDVAFNIIDIIS